MMNTLLNCLPQHVTRCFLMAEVTRLVTALAFCERTNTLFTGSVDQTRPTEAESNSVWHRTSHVIIEWKVQPRGGHQLTLFRQYSGHEATVNALCLPLSLDKEGAELLFSGSDDRTVRIWSRQSGECLGMHRMRHAILHAPQCMCMGSAPHMGGPCPWHAARPKPPALSAGRESL